MLSRIAMNEPFAARLLNEKRRAWLASPRNQLKLIALSVLLSMTSLGIGLQLDDHMHNVLVNHRDQAHLWWVEPPHQLDLFRFIDGDEADYRNAVETGTSAWFTSPRLRIAFMRPLASATHVFDYRVLRLPWLMHVHSLAWLFALGWAVARVVRRIERGWLAGLVVLFYVIDAGHGVSAGWLSARNALIAGVFGALALEAHIRFRRGELKTPLVALGFTVLCMLAGESFVGWAAWHFAFAIALDPEGPKRGLLWLVPLSTLTVVWRVVYRALGYGAGGSALYVDPLISPLAFARDVLEHAPQLLAGQMGGIPAGVLTPQGRSLELAAIFAGVLVVGVFVLASRKLLREHATVRFWALGALLATLPVCATQPHGRLMIAAGLGVLAVIAHFIADVMASPARTWRRALASYWLVVIVFIAPLGLALNAYGTTMAARPSNLAATSVPDDAAGKTLVVVAVPDMMFMCSYVTLMRVSQGEPTAARVRCLAGVETRAEVRRVDAHTLVVTAPDGLLSGFFVPLFRSPDDPFPEGWSLELSDVRYDIAARDEAGDPIALRVRFDKPLEDDAHVFVVWSPEEHAFVRFTPPAIGESVEVRGEPVTTVITGG